MRAISGLIQNTSGSILILQVTGIDRPFTKVVKIQKKTTLIPTDLIASSYKYFLKNSYLEYFTNIPIIFYSISLAIFTFSDEDRVTVKDKVSNKINRNSPSHKLNYFLMKNYLTIFFKKLFIRFMIRRVITNQSRINASLNFKTFQYSKAFVTEYQRAIQQ